MLITCRRPPLCCSYASFVESLESLSRDNLEFLRDRATKAMWELLRWAALVLRSAEGVYRGGVPVAGAAKAMWELLRWVAAMWETWELVQATACVASCHSECA